MDHASGEYKTICDGLLEGYKGKVYGNDDTGTEHDDSCTMQKVVLKDGKVVSASGELPLYNVIKDLSENNDNNDDENKNKTIIKTDSTTNIKLEAQRGIIPDDTSMNIMEIKAGTTFDKIKNVLVDSDNFKVFDIVLKSNNTIVQPNGKVKIKIPIPKDFDKSKLTIYRFEENGAKTEYQVTVENEYATFETEHFSIYVLGEKTKIADETQNDTEQNNTETNVGETTTEKNDTKLPQTGDETRKFTRWLSTAVILGIFWLVSMLLIDREKRRMANR